MNTRVSFLTMFLQAGFSLRWGEGNRSGWFAGNKTKDLFAGISVYNLILAGVPLLSS
jgi:hypothetical protein